MKNSHITQHSLHPHRQTHSHTSNTLIHIERYNTLNISDASRKWDKQTETADNRASHKTLSEHKEDILSCILAHSATTVSSDTNPLYPCSTQSQLSFSRSAAEAKATQSQQNQQTQSQPSHSTSTAAARATHTQTPLNSKQLQGCVIDPLPARRVCVDGADSTTAHRLCVSVSCGEYECLLKSSLLPLPAQHPLLLHPFTLMSRRTVILIPRIISSFPRRSLS